MCGAVVVVNCVCEACSGGRPMPGTEQVTGGRVAIGGTLGTLIGGGACGRRTGPCVGSVDALEGAGADNGPVPPPEGVACTGACCGAPASFGAADASESIEKRACGRNLHTRPCMLAARPAILRARVATRIRTLSAWHASTRTLESAIATGDAETLAKLYTPSTRLSDGDLRLALDTLVSAGVQGHTGCADTALRIFETHAETITSPQLISLGLRACLAPSEGASPPPSATGVFESLRTRFPEWVPDKEDWNAVLQVLVDRAPLRAVWSHLRAMAAAEIRPISAQINAFLVRLYASDQLRGVHRLLLSFGIEHLDTAGLEIVVRGHCSCSDADGTSSAVLTAAGEALREAVASGASTRTWHALLLYELHAFGAERMRATAEAALARAEFSPNDHTIALLLRGLIHSPAQTLITSDDALDVVRRASQAAGVLPGPHSYRLALRALLGAGESRSDPARMHEGVLFYQALRRQRVPSDAGLVQLLVDALCSAFLPALEPALALLDDVLPRQRRTFFSRQPRMQSPVHTTIFCSLLGACARLGALDTATALYAQMKELQVPMDPARALLHCRMLIRSAATHEDAFAMYKAAASLRAFNRHAFEQLLHFFCKNQLDGPFPPEYPLEILGDMRAAGFFPSAQTYTVLLDYYAKTPGSAPDSVRAVHELIKRDHTINIDLILINTLMNAYNRVGAPEEALQIWSTLVLLSRGRRRYMDEVSLVIIFDTCGRAGALDIARKAMSTAARLDAMPGARKLLTKAAYDAFVECLARCGAVDEAVGVVAAMKQDPATCPDAKTTDTLLKLARRAGHDDAAIRERLT